MTASDCPSPVELAEYATAGASAGAEEGAAASLGDAARARIEAHAAACPACRLQLAMQGLLREPVEEDEAAAVERVVGARGGAPALLEAAACRAGESALRVRFPEVHPGNPARAPASGASARGPQPVPASSRARVIPLRRRWLASGCAALAAAAALLLAVRREAPPDAELLDLQRDGRPLEAALSGLPYAEWRPHRGVEPDASWDKPLRKLLEAQERKRPGAERALAMLFLLRGGAGDAARTDALLARAGGDADTENDRGVALYARGDAAGALDAFDRALAAQPAHRPARFNRALTLQRLGMADRAAAAFEELAAQDAGSPFAQEARSRAQRLRAKSGAGNGAPRGTGRRAAHVALMSAGTREALQAAQQQVAALAAGLAEDLTRLARAAGARPEGELALRAALWARYGKLRNELMSGAAHEADAELFAREAASDVLIAAPSLQLVAYAKASRSAWREAQRVQLAVLRLCKRTPCSVETEAIALDELSEAAARDGDFATAHRLQSRAEALLASVDAELQLAELHRKRALLLLEEHRLPEAAESAALSLRELADEAVAGSRTNAARAEALDALASVAAARGQHHAALELHEGALALARASDDVAYLRDQLAGAIAVDLEKLGRFGDARAGLERAVADAERAGQPGPQALLRRELARLAEARGDVAGQLAEAARGLEAGANMPWARIGADLHVLHARALQQQGRASEANAELLAAVAQAAHAAATTAAPAAAAQSANDGRDAAVEVAIGLSQAGAAAADALLPLETLRAAALGTAPAAAGWSARLAAGACVVALLPSERGLFAAAISREGGEARVVDVSRRALAQSVEAVLQERASGGAGPAAAALGQQLFPVLDARCAASGEVWLFAEAPLDELDLTQLPWHGERLGRAVAAGMATTLSRVLAAEPALASAKEALIVHGVQAPPDAAGVAVDLPASARELSALLRAAPGAAAVELTGARATPEALLQGLPRAALVHLAAHGVDGGAGGRGYLQLAGEGGRLSADDLASARLREGARVVLSSCWSSAPGSRGLAWALSRAGASAVAAAAGRVGDGAAAAWSEAFYAALARGASFVQANHEALRAQPGADGAWFVVTR